MVRAGTRPRVLFLGTPGAFSLPPLAALLDAGLEVVAVFVPAPRPLLPGAPPIRGVQPVATPVELTLLRAEAEHSVIELAWARRVPVYQVGRLRDPAVLSLARELAPTTICVACFPAILPPELLAIPTSGALNVHPSLLPAFRGPAPIFWLFRHGERRTGVTIHLMDAGLDTGDIVAQEGFELPDGILGTEVNRRCAEIGGRLLVEAVEAMAVGRLDRQAQEEGEASYFSWPTAADFELPVTRPARWAFNFMRGADEWERPFEVVAGNERLMVQAALDWWPDRRLERPFVVQGNEILVQFTPGVLRGRLESSIAAKTIPAYDF